MPIFSSLTPLTQTFLLNFGLNAASFLISAPLQTEKLYDFTGTTTFIATALFSLSRITGGFSVASLMKAHPRQLLVSAMAITWASRLFGHLVVRVNLFGDRRFDKVKTEPQTFAFYYAFQVLWVYITSLPVYYVLLKPPLVQRKLFSVPTDAIGLSIWAFGFAYETIADAQKLYWQMTMKDKRFSEFMESGLFKYSRYPQYFGEMCVWTGMYVLCSGIYPWNSYQRYMLAASPIFVTWLLLRVSGVRIQEKQGAERYKDNKRWQEYVSSTSLLVPWFPLRKPPVKKE
ncbi:hypothetical protein HK098_005473 [Nowakowskiella sp. JEL0407]|nr:hypothetical protein HK098_005473 [Nowakowskiella sp. JEL0407]